MNIVSYGNISPGVPLKVTTRPLKALSSSLLGVVLGVPVHQVGGYFEFSIILFIRAGFLHFGFIQFIELVRFTQFARFTQLSKFIRFIQSIHFIEFAQFNQLECPLSHWPHSAAPQNWYSH